MRKSLRVWVGRAVFWLALPTAMVSSLVTSWLRKFRIQMYVLRRQDVILGLAAPGETLRRHRPRRARRGGRRPSLGSAQDRTDAANGRRHPDELRRL